MNAGNEHETISQAMTSTPATDPPPGSSRSTEEFSKKLIRDVSERTHKLEQRITERKRQESRSLFGKLLNRLSF
jgi:hypothetical protein